MSSGSRGCATARVLTLSGRLRGLHECGGDERRCGERRDGYQEPAAMSHAAIIATIGAGAAPFAPAAPAGCTSNRCLSTTLSASPVITQPALALFSSVPCSARNLREFTP